MGSKPVGEPFGMVSPTVQFGGIKSEGVNRGKVERVPELGGSKFCVTPRRPPVV
jgi:hypothetical protein